MLKSICFINSCKSWGGGEKWHFENAVELKRRGIYVCAVCGMDSPLAQKLKAAGIDVYEVNITNLSILNPLLKQKLIALFQKITPDTVIMNLPSDLKAAAAVAKRTGIKKIIYRRGSAIPVKDNFLNRKIFSEYITDIIANSEETKKLILQNNLNLFPKDKIHVVYNGIDFNKFDNLPDDILFEKAHGEIILGHAGRLSKQKNHIFLMNLMQSLEKRNNFRLLLAGSGELEDEIRRKTESAGLQSKIKFLGFQENIRQFMASIDIFLLPSLWEGFGYVLTEAMAAEKPVVAFNVSSNPEIIDQGKTGFLAEPDNLEQFRDYILELSENPQLRKEMGKNGRKSAEERFSFEKSTEKLLEII